MLKESKIQEFYVKWLLAEYKAGNLICYRIANEQKAGSLALVLKDKRMGNLKGFPDLGVILPNGRQFFIEFKRDKKKPTAEQITIHATLEAFNTPVVVIDNVSLPNNHKIINKVVELGGLTTLQQEYINDKEINKLFKKISV